MAFIVFGFITRYPFRAMRRMLLFWPTDCRKRQSPVLCLHTPFPHGYKSIPRGPRFSARNDIMCVARHKLRFWPNNRRTRQLSVFCLFIPFPREYTVSRGVPDFSLAMTGHPGVSRTARQLPCMNFGKCSICWEKFKKTYENIWICAFYGRKLHKNWIFWTFIQYSTIIVF